MIGCCHKLIGLMLQLKTDYYLGLVVIMVDFIWSLDILWKDSRWKCFPVVQGEEVTICKKACQLLILQFGCILSRKQDASLKKIKFSVFSWIFPYFSELSTSGCSIYNFDEEICHQAPSLCDIGALLVLRTLRTI